MANHVGSHLYFLRINAKAKEKLAMMLRWNEMQQGTGQLENFHELMEHAPEHPDYGWYHDHIGPKWCFFEEYDLDRIHCTSAWGWPEKGFNWIVSELRKEDPNLLAKCTYEDEAPCFYGVAGWGPRGYEDYYMDMKEGIDCFKKLGDRFDFIKPYLQENEDEEMPEEYHENLWEAIEIHQDMMWQECRGDVEPYEEDEIQETDRFPTAEERWPRAGEIIPEDRKVKVPFRFDSKGYDQSGQEYIELVDGGSDGYDDGKDFHGAWWETIPDSKEYGTIRNSVDAQHGDYDRKSDASGIQWLDHHAQAYNDEFNRSKKKTKDD